MPTAPWTLRLCHRLVSTAAVFVPLEYRGRWEEEWQAEIEHRWQQLNRWKRGSVRMNLSLVSQSLGTFPDALWVLQQLTVDSSFLLDLRHGFRLLLKNLGFTTVAVVVLALGIGINSVIFNVADATLFRPLPYADSDRVTYVLGWNTQQNRLRFNTSFQTNRALAEQATAFDAVGFHRWWTVNLTGQGEAEQLTGYQVSTNLFSLMGVPPLHGRGLSAADGEPGKDTVVVLSHRFWQRRFGGDSGILGRTLVLDDTAYQVVGIMPPGFEYPQFNTIGDLWSPMPVDPDPVARDRTSLVTVARLRQDVTLPQAQAEVDAVLHRLQESDPERFAHVGAKVNLIQEWLAERTRPAIAILAAAVGLVFLIAAANVSNMILMRAVGRNREMSLRHALGAGRGRLIRQMLAETLVLFLLGGMASLLVSHWGLRLVQSLVPDSLASSIPSLQTIGLDNRTLLFALGLSAGAGLLFGLLPAWQASRRTPWKALREGGRTVAGRRGWLRSSLVAGEVALSMILLVTTGLLARSFLAVVDVDPGFEPDRLLSLSLTVPANRYPETQGFYSYVDRLLERVRAVPGVEAAATVNSLPFSTSNSTTRFTVIGAPTPEPDDIPSSDLRIVSPGYFKTLGIPLVEGRPLTEQDRADSSRTVVVNQTLAERYFPGGRAIGRQIRIGNGPGEPAFTVVGVVGDVKHWDLRWESQPELYVLFTQSGRRFFTLAVRTQGEPLNATASIRSAIQALDSNVPASGIRTMNGMIRNSVLAEATALYLMLTFAGIALLLALTGLYGVLSYTVASQTHELGVRRALGADGPRVIRLVLRGGMLLILPGLGAGLLASLALGRLLSSQLYGIGPADPLIFTGVGLALVLAGLAACYVPARRAANVDPMIALRYE